LDWLQQLELPPQTVNQEQIDTEKDEKSLTYIGSSFEEFLQTLEEGETPSSDEEFLQMLKEDISESPPAVESQYRQETVNPPRSVKPKKEPEAVQQKNTVKTKSSQNSIQQKQKKVLWGWLIGVFLVYGLSGYILGINSAHWQVVAMVVAWAGVMAMAGTVGVAIAGAVAGAVAGNWVMAVAVAVAWAVVGAWAGASVGTAVEGMAGEKLLKYFSRFHSFLILASTSLSGLGSGWLLGFLLHPKG
jgi:serine/threonine-protein kinase